MNTRSRTQSFLSLTAVATVALAFTTTSAKAVLLGGFDGDNIATAPLQDASVVGSVTVTMAGLSAGNFGDGSGLWGMTDLDPDPSTATGTNTSTNVRQLHVYDLDLTVTNNATTDLTLDQVHINLQRDSGSSLTSGDLIYVSGDLDDPDNTTILTQALSGVSGTGTYVGYDMSLAGGLTDVVLGAGESATLRWRLAGSPPSNAWIRADNFAISGELASVVPEPSTFALAALGLLGLTRLRRRRR